MDNIKYTHNENGEGEKGFTLIEVLVAIAILSFGLIAMNFMQTQSVRGNAGAQALTEMTWVASDAFEGLLAENYDDIGTGNCGDFLPEKLKEVCTGIPTNYNVSWTVSKTNNIATIDVTVIHKSTGKKLVYDYYKTNLL